MAMSSFVFHRSGDWRISGWGVSGSSGPGHCASHAFETAVHSVPAVETPRTPNPLNLGSTGRRRAVLCLLVFRGKVLAFFGAGSDRFAVFLF